MALNVGGRRISGRSLFTPKAACPSGTDLASTNVISQELCDKVKRSHFIFPPPLGETRSKSAHEVAVVPERLSRTARIKYKNPTVQKVINRRYAMRSCKF